MFSSSFKRENQPNIVQKKKISGCLKLSKARCLTGTTQIELRTYDAEGKQQQQKTTINKRHKEITQNYTTHSGWWWWWWSIGLLLSGSLWCTDGPKLWTT